MKFFVFPHLFSLIDLDKHVIVKIESVLFINFIIFDPHSFNCIKFQFFIFLFFHPLAFCFYIKFVLLFYDISGLTINVLISNLNSCLFYQILIYFQFHPWIHDFIFNSFIFVLTLLIFIFVLGSFVYLIFIFNSRFDDI